MQINLWVSAGTDFNSRTDSLGIQSNTFDIWGLQVEAGSVATAFQTATGTLAGELAACQRYYFRSTGPNVYSLIANGFGTSTTLASVWCQAPVPLRTIPSSVEWANLQISDVNGASVPSSIVIGTASCSSTLIYMVVTSTGLTNGKPYVVACNNNAAGYLGFSAEL